MNFKGKEIKLLICDIDQTLTEKGGQLLPCIKRALDHFHENGVCLGLATGRPIDSRTIGRFEKWGLVYPVDVLAGLNGCELYFRETGEKRTIAKLDKEEIKAIVDFMWPLNTNILLFEEGYDRVLARRYDDIVRASVDRNDSNVEIVDKEGFSRKDSCKIQFHCDESQIKQAEEVIRNNPREKSEMTVSFPGTYEFMPKGINKGVALIEICKQLGIDLDNVIACGDMDNDASMIKAAGIGVCLKNGSDYAKSCADYVTRYPVEEDGLGRFLLEIE